MAAMLKLPLDLPYVRILKTELLPDEIIITVESTRQSAVCHQCRRETRKFHTYGRTVRLRHLPILGRRVYLELRPKRFECRKCPDRPTTTQQLDWYDPHSPHTKAYEQSLLISLINSTIADVARKQGVSEEAVLGAVDRHIPSQVDWAEFSSLAVIGLDEIARTKGHRDFITIVSARPTAERIAILRVLPGREKETVAALQCRQTRLDGWNWKAHARLITISDGCRKSPNVRARKPRPRGFEMTTEFTPSPLFERVERARRRKPRVKDTHITLAHGSGGSEVLPV
ncbi:MAG: transposase family protein [Blastocatellia bacterium]